MGFIDTFYKINEQRCNELIMISLVKYGSSKIFHPSQRNSLPNACLQRRDQILHDHEDISNYQIPAFRLKWFIA